VRRDLCKTRLAFGGDYNPEQWPRSTWLEDIALMQQAKVNLVTVGVFAWSRLEPRPGEHDFDWLDEVLDLLHDGGIRVNLATPTAAPPPWFAKAYPDTLPVTADGTRLAHGSRDTYCAAAPAYREAATAIARTLADRYRSHPALAMWHVHNEYGTVCHCDHAEAAFRQWLRDKYQDLDALNDAWTTTFWSQRYGDWDEITPPRATQWRPNPTQVLDFRRFWSDQLLTTFQDQREVIRQRTPGVPITTNFVLADWAPIDHARWAREVDLVAIDHYPNDAGPDAEAQTAFAADLARGWNQSWLLMECAPNLIYDHGRMHHREPDRLVRQCLAHVARGSHGALVFQWRAPRGGAELFHSALLPHAGPDSRVFRATVHLGHLLARIAEFSPGTVEASAAILHDDQSRWALQTPDLPRAGIDYLGEVRAVHAAFWHLGITVDIAGRPGEQHRLAVVPARFIVDDDLAAALTAYVERGGHLVVTFLTGLVDEHLHIGLGGYPAKLRHLLGIRVEELHPLAGPAYWTELVRLHGAVRVGPDLTRHEYGRGVAWYSSTRLDRATLEAIAGEAGVERSGAPAGVEVIKRQGCLFALNHTDREQRLDGGLVLAPGGVAVVQDGLVVQTDPAID
jgi:beta-galactosidase